MKNTLIIILVTVVVVSSLVAGCASLTLPVGKLHPGMTRVEVEELFDTKPIAYSKTGTVDVITYEDWGGVYLYTLFFMDGKLVEWYRSNGRPTGNFVGTSIVVPTSPPRH